MKKFLILLMILFCLTGCGRQAPACDIAATTGPVYELAQAITQGTDLTVVQVVTDQVSCLHDYSLSVRQMELLETCKAVAISGGGLEHFMSDLLASAPAVIDCAGNIPLLTGEEGEDPHIWLDPALAKKMAENLTDGLSVLYPEQEKLFRQNLQILLAELDELLTYGQESLQTLNCRQLITFHDGFRYLAEAFDLEILAAMEEEAGSQVSAKDLTVLVNLVEENHLPAVFTEKNGSPSAASVVTAETGVPAFSLDMAMNSDYFQAMKGNIDTLKEALG